VVLAGARRSPASISPAAGPPGEVRARPPGRAGLLDLTRARHKAARYYDVDLSETNWHQLGVHPQPNREESARKGAETRMRTGEAEEAALKGAATRERLGISEEAAEKAAATRRREREEAEGHRET